MLGLAELTADGSCGLAGSKAVGKSTLVQHECLARPEVCLQQALPAPKKEKQQQQQLCGMTLPCAWQGVVHVLFPDAPSTVDEVKDALVKLLAGALDYALPREGNPGATRAPFEPARGAGLAAVASQAAPHVGAAHFLVSGAAWKAVKDAVERAAVDFEAIHKRPVVLVIDGADNIAKGDRKLACDIVLRAKARAACCQRPSQSGPCESACCEVPAAACLHRRLCAAGTTAAIAMTAALVCRHGRTRGSCMWCSWPATAPSSTL